LERLWGKLLERKYQQWRKNGRRIEVHLKILAHAGFRVTEKVRNIATGPKNCIPAGLLERL